MRLIDADAFKEYMRKALEETRGCYPDNGEWAEAVTEQFCEDIDDQPTVEPERKKGKWIIKDNPGTGWCRVTCSECGEDVTRTAPCIGFYPNVKVMWDYCPDCGADMRGEKCPVNFVKP